MPKLGSMASDVLVSSARFGRGVHEKAGRCQAKNVSVADAARICHSFLSEIVRASRRAPVKAERSEPQGSLDRVARCEIL